jgi:hypothetical protein
MDPAVVVPAQAGTHSHGDLDRRWPYQIVMLRRMGPRLRGHDNGESLPHIFFRGSSHPREDAPWLR